MNVEVFSHVSNSQYLFNNLFRIHIYGVIFCLIISFLIPLEADIQSYYTKGIDCLPSVVI